MGTRFDEYQTVVGGKRVLVSDLTLDQAKAALCDAYDLIDELDEATTKAGVTIDKWKRGDIEA